MTTLSQRDVLSAGGSTTDTKTRGIETCCLCAGGHKLKECRSPAEQYKCVNCMTYNRHSKADKVSENHSSLDKNCPCMQAVLAKYRLNTD